MRWFGGYLRFGFGFGFEAFFFLRGGQLPFPLPVRGPFPLGPVPSRLGIIIHNKQGHLNHLDFFFSRRLGGFLLFSAAALSWWYFSTMQETLSMTH